MFTKRIIPCLDINRGQVVKGVNFAAIGRPQRITEAGEKFGRQCVVVAIEVRRRKDGGWNICKRNCHGQWPMQWIFP